MNLFNKISNIFKAKSFVTGFRSFFQDSAFQPTNKDFLDAYSDCHLVYTCVKKIGEAVAKTELKLFKVKGSAGKEEIDEIMDHPILDLIDKVTGQTYPTLNRLEDTEDVGDEYDYSRCTKPHTVTSEHVQGRVRVLEDGGLRARLEAEFTLALPAAIGRDRERRGWPLSGP